MLWFQFFVLLDESGQAIIAALHEIDAENYGEEDVLIICTRCQEIGENNGIVMQWRVKGEGKVVLEKKTPPSIFR